MAHIQPWPEPCTKANRSLIQETLLCPGRSFIPLFLLKSYTTTPVKVRTTAIICINWQRIRAPRHNAPLTNLWFPTTRGEETGVKTSKFTRSQSHRLQSSHFAHGAEENIYIPYIFYISKKKVNATTILKCAGR